MLRSRSFAQRRPARRSDAVGRQARASDDAFHSAGLNFPPLSKDVGEKLARDARAGSIIGNPLDAGFAAVVDPSIYMKSIRVMIEDLDTDIVIIDAELPKAPHELRERNLRVVDDMASAASRPVIYISPRAKRLISRTKAGVKIRGYRGKLALNENSVIKALVGLSNLIADASGRIASVDVSPFLVTAKLGVGVDAFVVLQNDSRNSADQQNGRVKPA